MSIIRRKNALRICIEINPRRPKAEEEQSTSINTTCLPEQMTKKAPPQISYYLWQTSQATDNTSHHPVFLSKVEMVNRRRRTDTGRMSTVLKKRIDIKKLVGCGFLGVVVVGFFSLNNNFNSIIETSLY